MKLKCLLTTWMIIQLVFIPAFVITTSARTPGGDITDRKAYFDAKRHYDEGRFEAAVNAFQQFITNHPGSGMIPESYFLLGQSYVRLSKYSEAVVPLKILVEDFPAVPFAGEARRQLGRVYLQLGMAPEAIAILEQEASLNRDDLIRQELYSQISELYLNLQQELKAIDALLKQRQSFKDRADRLVAEQKIQQIMEQLSDQQLASLFQKHPTSFPGDEHCCGSVRRRC
jgi:tetratricopeptide (TPR) repeat protein